MVDERQEATKKPMNKTDILTALADASGLSKQQVGGLLDELAKLIGKNLAAEGPGVFTVPGLIKIHVKRMPATPERQGVNPFTKQPIVIKAKPARNVVKVRALKSLKDMV